MKKSVGILLLVSFTILFSQCKKEGDGKMFKGHFYAMSSNAADGDLYLYIDGNLKGILPYNKTQPLCNDSSIEKHTYFLSIKSGNYKFEAKTINGTVISSANEFFSANEASGNSNKGSEFVSVSDDCLIVGLGE